MVRRGIAGAAFSATLLLNSPATLASGNELVIDVADFDVGNWPLVVPPTILQDNVTIRTVGFGPFDPEARNGIVPQFVEALLVGQLTIDGNVQFVNLDGGGSIAVTEGSALHGPESGDLLLTSMQLDGTLTGGSFNLGGTGVLDATNGLLALGSSVNTLGVAFSGDLEVDGDLILGDWANGGAEGLPPVNGANPYERIDVTGTLDLTKASLLYDEVFVSYDPLVSPNLPNVVQSSYVIATYGNRIGAFDQEHLDLIFGYTQLDGRRISGKIVYTSGENDGPGEVRVVLPEPASAGLAMLFSGIALRWRR